MKRYSILLSLSIILISFGVAADPAAALAEKVRVRFDAATIVKGYTAEYNQSTHPSWGDFRVGILPNLVNEQIDLELKQFDGSTYPDPEGMTRVSDYYIYDILRQDQANKEPLVLNKPFHLALKFDSGNLWRKRVYFWNKPTSSWVQLPSSIDYDSGYVRAITHLPFSRVAVFEDQQGVEGKASWYRSSRYLYGAASNDFPLGTELTVRNIANGKTVNVTVVSTGPFLPISERRVVDLTLPAFLQIEEQWKGVARVQVWVKGQGGVVLGAETSTPAPPAVAQPQIDSTAVIAINKNTEEILYSKNYDTILPIASLTKLMTAQVFLDTGVSFDTVVTYVAEDNAIGSKLYVNPGETMTVRDLWYSMLTGSANNAANALARASGLSRGEFVSRMNATAAAWGLGKTHFVDVNGLDPGNTSTVYDVARMAKHVFKNFTVLQGTTTAAYSFRTINTDHPHTIKNTATGMQGSPLVITGMKTGYLDEAGRCFVLQASQSRETDNVITVVLGARSDSERWDETNQLANYAISKL